MVISDRRGMDSERRVARPGVPLTAFSIGLVTSCSTCWAVRPGASVWISTVEGTNSGNTSSGARRVAHSPAISAIRVRVAMVPAKRTQRLTSQRMASVPGCGAGIDLPGEQQARAGDDQLAARLTAGHEIPVAQ